MEEQALSGLRVVEYASGISAPYCAKLFADLGAEVIKLEDPKGGDSARQMGPFAGDIPHPERSGLFLYLNTNKLGVTLNLNSSAGQRIFRGLIREADIFIEDTRASAKEKLGIDYASVKSTNPSLIMVSVTPFGQSGPYRDYKAVDLVTCHMGGVGYGTPPNVEEPETHPPLKLGGNQPEFFAGVAAATAAMYAVLGRAVNGCGQHIDLSAQDALSATMVNNLAYYSYQGLIPTRLKARTIAFMSILACKDGYVSTVIIEERQWQQWVEVLGNPDWASNELFASPTSRNQNWDALTSLIEEWTTKHTKEEVWRAAQARHVPVLPVNTSSDVVKSFNLAGRGFFVDVEHGEAGNIRYPGAPYKFSQSPWAIRRPAPLLGQHNEEVFVGRLGFSRGELVRLRQSGVI